MTRRIFGPGLAVAIVALALTACGPAQVNIIAAVGDDADAAPINALEIQLLPYDRDAVFDSLEMAAPRPEPEIPADLLEAQQEIAQARASWRQAEDRWNLLRDTVSKLSERLEQMDQSTREYQELYNHFDDLDIELGQVEGSVASFFGRFTRLDSAATDRRDSVRMVREGWADEAFADVGDVIAARIEASGLSISVDTTDTAGLTLFEVAPGDYWVHARYEPLPGEELYWNFQITVARGEPMQVRLSRENAEVRPVF